MKKYRLKKDLPNVKAGTIFTFDNPEWFELIEEEPIKVQSVTLSEIPHPDSAYGVFRKAYYHEFSTNQEVPLKYISKIKKAIEYIVNDKEGIWSDKDMIDFAKSISNINFDFSYYANALFAFKIKKQSH